MKNIILLVTLVIVTIAIGCQPTKVANDTRDYAYEAYCDSIYKNDKDYYLDVLVETDEYQTYITEHEDYWFEINKD